MTATSRPGRRIACVALLAAIPLTACAAGYQAETSRERTTLTSVAAAKGDLTLRNIFFVGPGVVRRQPAALPGDLQRRHLRATSS